MIADQNKVWRSGVILKKEDTLAEVIEYYGKREIRIRVTGKSKRDLLVIITHELDKIHNSFHGLKFNKMVPCNCVSCKDSQEPNFYPFSDLIDFRKNNQYKIQCRKSPYQMVEVLRLIDDVSETTRRWKGANRDKVFVSYSHKDKDIFERVQVHLKALENEGVLFSLWDDTKIKPGMNWRDEIENAISAAKVVVLLVSTDFFASDFIQTNELPPLLTAAKNDGATILPLIIKPCRFRNNKELSVFQAVNDPAEPLSKMNNNQQEETLVELTENISRLMKIK
ncbi:MAG: toll/interleukin-1 receptor domain-containing protein [Desulfobacterales bacterium]